MNILLISAYFPPDTGSAAHLFYELGTALVNMGHQVTVLTSFPSYHAQGDLSRYRGKRYMEEDVEGIRVVRVKVPQFPRHIPAGRALWQFSLALSFSFAAFKISTPDVCLVYSPPLPLGYTAWFLKKRKGVPFILNVQDLFPKSAIDLGILKNKALIKFFEAMERWIYRHSDLITVHSPLNRDHVVMKGGVPERVEVIPNWVDTNFVKPGSRKNGFREEWKLGDQFVVSFAGIMGYSQDLDVVIESACKLRYYSDIKFLLVGDGVKKESLKKKVISLKLNNVSFIPMQPRKRYPLVLQASDICLVTLKKNVLSPVVPSKLLSIMAAGRPVIACLPQEGDAPKIIKEAQCGYCLEAGDVEGLSRAIIDLYKNPVLRRKFGENGRRYAEKNFSLDICSQKYELVFKRILGLS